VIVAKREILVLVEIPASKVLLAIRVIKGTREILVKSDLLDAKVLVEILEKSDLLVISVLREIWDLLVKKEILEK
jgi:hypothetical protein